MEQEKPLSSEESLRIITSMINTTKGNVQNSSFYFLLWGWVVMFASLAHFTLSEFTSYPYPYAIWAISIPTLLVCFIHGRRTGRKKTVVTYLDKINFWIWMAFIISMVILQVFAIKTDFTFTPLIMVFAGYAVFLSGITLKYRPLVWGGISFWVFCIGAYLTKSDYQLLFMALAVLTGYLIPGYMLKKKGT